MKLYILIMLHSMCVCVSVCSSQQHVLEKLASDVSVTVQGVKCCLLVVEKTALTSLLNYFSFPVCFCCFFYLGFIICFSTFSLLKKPSYLLRCY